MGLQASQSFKSRSAPFRRYSHLTVRTYFQSLHRCAFIAKHRYRYSGYNLHISYTDTVYVMLASQQRCQHWQDWATVQHKNNKEVRVFMNKYISWYLLEVKTSYLRHQESSVCWSHRVRRAHACQSCPVTCLQSHHWMGFRCELINNFCPLLNFCTQFKLEYIYLSVKPSTSIKNWLYVLYFGGMPFDSRSECQFL